MLIDESNQCCDGTRETVKYALCFGSIVVICFISTFLHPMRG